jgi:LysM repeat protein
LSAIVLPLAAVSSLLIPPGVASAATSAGTYTVQDGDALYGIAGRAGVSIDALLKANSLRLTSIIIPGQKLLIPAGGKVPSPPASAPSAAATARTAATAPPATTAAPAAVAGSTYVVQSGDMPIAIAFRFGVNPDALLKANKLNLQSVIVPGQKLVIPSGGTVPLTTGNPRIDLVIAAAKAQLGKPYKFGYDGPNAFDCSGLVRFAFAKIGMTLLHNTLLQKNSFPAVAVTDLRPGDIVFFHDDFHHEGLYLGNSLIIQAPAPGMNVQISWVPMGWITGAVRPVW